MQLPLIGGSFKHVSQDVNYQKCINLYPVAAGPDGRGKGALIPTAGLQSLVDLGDAEVRDIKVFGDYVYVVVGNTIKKLTVNANSETASSVDIGTLSTSTGVVHSAINPTQIIWVDGTAQGRLYTPGSDTFSNVKTADSDFTGGSHVVFIDGYFIVNAPDTGTFYTSAANNGLSWDATDVATAESSTDNIVGLGVAKGELWVFGENSVEIWYDAANVSGSPFSVRSGLELRTGCGAAHSITEFNDTLIWLDNRGYIVQSSVAPFVRNNNSGYDLTIISDEALTSEILSYSRRDDAIGCAYVDRGHLMYQITFPSEKKTWVYDYNTKVWHERLTYDNYTGELQHHLMQFYASYQTIHIAGGVRDGQLYLQKPDVYDDNGLGIRRIRVVAPQYDTENLRIVGVDQVRLRAETGHALQSGEGSAPEIELRYSNDGGHTWSNAEARSLGAVGQYALPIEWNRLGYGREWLFEFSITSPIKFSLIEATVSVEELED